MRDENMVRKRKDKLFIKQFGLQRSGTNALKALLEMNFPKIRVLTTFLGNKHHPMNLETLETNSRNDDFAEFGLNIEQTRRIQEEIKDKSLPIIFQIKKPIPWFDSYFRYQKQKIQFSNPDANPLFDERWVVNSLSLWNKSVGSWLEFSKKYSNCLFFEHIELLTNPDDVVQRISEKFSFEKNRKIDPIENEMKRGHYKEHGKDLINPYHKFDPSFHTDNKWLENYTPQLLEFAKLKVDELISSNKLFSESGFDFESF